MTACQIQCPACGWRTICGEQDVERRLRAAGMLRREPRPEPAVMVELLIAAAAKLTCPECGGRGLVASGEIDEDNGDWQQARPCDACGQPIERERLEALPDAEYCAACQRGIESGQPAGGAIEYCPKCGAAMTLRLSTSAGVARYKLVCTGSPPCRL